MLTMNSTLFMVLFFPAGRRDSRPGPPKLQPTGNNITNVNTTRLQVARVKGHLQRCAQANRDPANRRRR